MTRRATPPARLWELLAAEAAGDLGLEESLELTRLLDAYPAAGDEFMTIAALAQIAALCADTRGLMPMPADLEARLKQQASDWSAGRSRAPG